MTTQNDKTAFCLPHLLKIKNENKKRTYHHPSEVYIIKIPLAQNNNNQEIKAQIHSIVLA